MKYFLYFIWLFLTAFMPKQKPLRVIFFGDSITEAGAKPGGYIMRISDALKAKGLSGKYDLIGAGIGGNKVYDLYLRMDDDVLAKNPDIVFIWIGVNDVWHKTLTGTGTDADKFEKFYTAIIQKLKARSTRIILCTPAAIGEKTDCTNQQDGDLNKYAGVIRNLSYRYHCELVDFRKIFQQYSLQNNPENKESGVLTMDRVHLNERGNQLAADKMLEQLLK
ncbi:MAG: G-D-S-L family lipolytic protein [Bacteroidetes bacterium]|nr:MAG: G-D-S-L family lipolytic protein [Bacteroidota bacterium]